MATAKQLAALKKARAARAKKTTTRKTPVKRRVVKKATPRKTTPRATGARYVVQVVTKKGAIGYLKSWDEKGAVLDDTVSHKFETCADAMICAYALLSSKYARYLRSIDAVVEKKKG